MEILSDAQQFLLYVCREKKSDQHFNFFFISKKNLFQKEKRVTRSKKISNACGRSVYCCTISVAVLPISLKVNFLAPKDISSGIFRMQLLIFKPFRGQQKNVLISNLKFFLIRQNKRVTIFNV